MDMEEEVPCWVCGRRSTRSRRLDVSAEAGCRTTSTPGSDMMEYCLDIHLDEKMVGAVILCAKCCGKLTSFYKFKRLARKSLLHLQSVYYHETKSEDEAQGDRKAEEDVEATTVKEENAEVKSEEVLVEVKEEIHFDHLEFVNSDEELLSVLKLNEDQTENTVATKRRGRRKLDKRHKLSYKTEGVCDHCGKNVRCLATHLKLHLPDGSRKRVPCKVCDKTFATPSSRYRHNKIKHLGIKESCDKCNKTVCDLRQHDLQIHNPDKLPMLCIVCGRRFVSQSQLDQHMTMHTKLKQHQCPDCGEQFRLKVTMLNHKRRVHDGEKTHLCQYCSKGFFKKYHLTLHLRLHTNERPMECAECGKRFRTDSGLRVHLKRHSGLRDHTCSVCKMAFINAGALTAHTVTHTKERRYKCAYCDARFGRSDHRNRHQRTAHHKPP